MKAEVTIIVDLLTFVRHAQFHRWVMEESEAAVSVERNESPEAPSSGISPEKLHTLTRKKWYLGDGLSEEAADSVLNASNSSNCFGVYKSSEDRYVLSAKYQLEGEGAELLDHLVVVKGSSGNYKLPGQGHSYEDIQEAVEEFVVTFNPPLEPALYGSAFETQISLSDDPPDYSSANKVLKPDIAPLPNIGTVKVDSVIEAKTGRISPQTSFDIPRRFNFHTGAGRQPQAHVTSSQWHHYQYLHRCHPKNTCYGCCYRARDHYSIHRYRRKWYDCRNSGPLRVLGLILFWIVCGLCFGCFKSCSFLCTLCIYFITYDES